MSNTFAFLYLFYMGRWPKCSVEFVAIFTDPHLDLMRSAPHPWPTAAQLHSSKLQLINIHFRKKANQFLISNCLSQIAPCKPQLYQTKPNIIKTAAVLHRRGVVAHFTSASSHIFHLPQSQNVGGEVETENACYLFAGSLSF